MKKITIIILTLITIGSSMSAGIAYIKQVTCFNVSWTFCDNNNNCKTYTAKICWGFSTEMAPPIGSNLIKMASIQIESPDNLEGIVFKAGEQISLFDENNNAYLYRNTSDRIIDNLNKIQNADLELIQ